jgi:hypothetical protein
MVPLLTEYEKEGKRTLQSEVDFQKQQIEDGDRTREEVGAMF